MAGLFFSSKPPSRLHKKVENDKFPRKGEINMEVTKLDKNEFADIMGKTDAPEAATEETLKKEYKYHVGMKSIKGMQTRGIISEQEANVLQRALAEKFSPVIAGILPKTTCY